MLNLARLSNYDTGSYDVGDWIRVHPSAETDFSGKQFPSSGADRATPPTIGHVIVMEGEVDKALLTWSEETRWVSSLQRMMDTGSARVVLRGGDISVRMILKRMARGEINAQWFPALQRLSGVNPVPAHERGVVPAMQGYWVEWGRQQGKLP